MRCLAGGDAGLQTGSLDDSQGGTVTDLRARKDGKDGNAGAPRGGPVGIFSFSSLLLLAFVSGGWSGVAIVRTLLADEELLVGHVVDGAVLHRLGLDALVLDISNSGLVSDLNRGPLVLTEGHVRRVLYATYDEEDTSEKAREVHRAFFEFIEVYPERPIFAVSIADERPVLADSLGRIFVAQYSVIPDCSFGEDAGAILDAGGVALFGGSGDEFYYRDHPDCRPAEVVASRVEEGIRAEMAEMAQSGPDSVDAFPEEAGDPSFAATVEKVRRGLLFGKATWPGAILICSLAGVLFLCGSRYLWKPAFAYGAGLFVVGFVSLTWAPAKIEERFEGAGTVGEASEIWGILGHEAIQSVAAFTGLWSLMAGGIISLSAGGVGYLMQTGANPGIGLAGPSTQDYNGGPKSGG